MSGDFRIAGDFDRVSLSLAPMALCEALLMDDARYLWVVLIPRKPDLVELDDLTASERAALMEEAVEAGSRVRRIGEALSRPIDKVNTAALGNVTRQLHVHVIGRQIGDAAWPRPVWGVGEATAWDPAAVETIRSVWG